MGSLTNFAENALLNHTFNGNAYTPAATLYLALCTADPTDAATGAAMNEVPNAGAYARQPITFGAAASRRVTQNALVQFPQVTAGWGDLTHWAVCDSATYGAGNVLAHGSLGGSPRTVVTGNRPSVASGVVYVEMLAGAVSDYLAHALYNLMFRNQAFSLPATYIGLTTATIADGNTGSTITEPSGNAYARVLVNANGGASPAWSAVAGGALSNGADVDMPDPTGDWGTVVAMAILDAATAGNLLYYDNDTVVDQPMGLNDTVSFPAGSLDVSLS